MQMVNIIIQILLSTFKLQHPKLKPTQNNILLHSIPKQINNQQREYDQRCPTQLLIIQFHNDINNNLYYDNKVFEWILEVMNDDDTDTDTGAN